MSSQSATSAHASPLSQLKFGDLIAGAAGREVLATGDVGSTDVLVAFSFGSGCGGRISPVNERIAAVAQIWPALPLITQTEVAIAAARLGRTVIDVESEARRGRRPTAYVDTAAVAERATKLINDAGWTKVGLIAHPFHAPRCVATCLRLGLEPVVAGWPDEDSGKTSAGTVKVDQFDAASTQWWTRSRRSWLARELLVLPYQRIRNKI